MTLDPDSAQPESSNEQAEIQPVCDPEKMALPDEGAEQFSGEVNHTQSAASSPPANDTLGVALNDHTVQTTPDVAIHDHITTAEVRILEAFERKLAFDQFKEQQIERLHTELQEHKRGLSDSILLPLVKQIVRYVDQLPRHVSALRSKPAEQLGPERLFRELEGVREDLLMILENIGVRIYENPDTRFDAKVQQARKTEKTSDPARHHEIVERLLPGFEMNGRLIEKERVNVCVYQDGGPAESKPEFQEPKQ